MKFIDSKQQKTSFSEMGLPSSLLTNIEKMGLLHPTPVQCQAIPSALSGSDLLAIAQTGSGKTLAYALPVLSSLMNNPEARALILLPSREIADQVYRVLMALSKENSISSSLVISGIPNVTQVSQLKKNPKLIVATPGRLVEHLRNNKLLLKGLKILVLDEADRMLDMGFSSQLKIIRDTLRGQWQTLMVAASFGSWASAVARTFMGLEAILVRTESAETPVYTLEQKIIFMTSAQKNNQLRDALKTMKGGVIVFTESMESCAAVGRFLAHHDFSSDFMHGDMNPGHRNRVLREFRDEKIQILITTDLLARGLDLPHVQNIISFELPYKSEDFLHRIGRTARAGRKGNALTFVTASDGRTFRKMTPYLQGAIEETITPNFKFFDRD
jgi:ATP-dependent RNA helicase RhlE